MIKHSSRSFTIVELLIVISIVTVVSVAFLILLNPFKQVTKSWDGKRKQELATLQKTFQDFYSDNNSFPVNTDVCYDAVVVENGTCSCHICGQESAKTAFPPYLQRLPCDPQHRKFDYLYQYNCTDRNWFKVFTYLDKDDPAAATAAASNSYNFTATSGNIDPAPYPTISTLPREPMITPTPVFCSEGTTTCYILNHGIYECKSCSLCNCQTYCTVNEYFIGSCDGQSCQLPDDLICP